LFAFAGLSLCISVQDYSRSCGHYFVIIFVMVEESAPLGCNSKVPTELTEASGSIVSPGYFSGNYPNDADCKWRVKVKENMVSFYLFYIIILFYAINQKSALD